MNLRPPVAGFCLTLLALAGGCGRQQQQQQQGNTDQAAEWFRDVAEESGIRFRHNPKAEGRFYMPEIMGSGCALLDFDNDGDLDVFLVQAEGPHRLYRNEGGLRFREVENTGIASRPQSAGMGVATADFDRDGFVDLLVTAFGANTLYRNNQGNGSFTDVTSGSPDLALQDRWSTSATFFDYDLDGWLDLVILNYVDYSLRANKACYAPTGELDYCTPRVYQPLPAHLFHNEKGRGFRAVPRSGLETAAGPGLGVVALDANQDGWPDLFVANDSMANHLWINQKNGTFVEQALAFGAAYGEEGLAKAGMGVAAGDYDNDGDEDLLVLNLMREGATLFRNDGAVKGFSDVSQAAGIHAVTMPWTGFGVAWQDFDRDGWLDLFVANGAVTRREEQRGQPYPFAERNLVLRQAPAGKFVEMPSPRTGIARGAAFGDIDQDGDIDILLNMNNGAARLLRNDAPGAAATNHWIAVEGPAEGSRVEVRVAGKPGAQVRWLRSGGSYLSASPARAYFGLGPGGAAGLTVDSLTVWAPGGASAPLIVRNPTLNRVHKLPLRPR